jgi:hypothetical protein
MSRKLIASEVNYEFGADKRACSMKAEEVECHCIH